MLKRTSSRKGLQVKKIMKSKATKSRSGSRTKAGRRAITKTRTRNRVKTTNDKLSPSGTRLPLSPLGNLDQSAILHYPHPRLPISSDPWEKPCIEADPMPEDYVFVPKGDVYITKNCKCHSRDTASTIYLVYDKQGKQQLGIRVREGTHKHVIGMAQQTAETRAEAVRIRDERDQKRARKVLQKKFPTMPPSSLETVLKHAFLKGSGRVGRSTRQTDEKKAILAVEAHIRHTLTSYEELLDGGLDREKARSSVWNTVQTIKEQWAGDKAALLVKSTRKSKAKR